MKTFLVSLGATIAAFAAVSNAADENKMSSEKNKAEAAQMIDRRMEMMTERLKLTPEQAAKIRSIMLSDQEKFLEMRDDASLTPEERNKRAGEILQKSRVELQAVLTPEQKEIWKAEAEKQQKQAQEKQRQESSGEKK